jgi:hypothetical protein
MGGSLAELFDDIVVGKLAPGTCIGANVGKSPRVLRTVLVGSVRQIDTAAGQLGDQRSSSGQIYVFIVVPS